MLTVTLTVTRKLTGTVSTQTYRYAAGAIDAARYCAAICQYDGPEYQITTALTGA